MSKDDAIREMLRRAFAEFEGKVMFGTHVNIKPEAPAISDADLKRHGLERVPSAQWSANLWKHNLHWFDEDCTKEVRFGLDLYPSEYGHS